MIHVKEGVFFHPRTFQDPCMCRIIYIAQKYAPEGYHPTITSGAEGGHKANSKHYKGLALDFRVRDFPEGKSVKTWEKYIRKALGSEYFVLNEETHLHIQKNEDHKKED